MVYGFYNLLDKIKRYYVFNTNEKLWLIASVALLAFIAGFNDPSKVFSFSGWFGNFFLCLIAVAVAIFVHESVRRIMGLEQGFRVEFKPFMYGLIAGLVLAFMSYGKLIFLAYGGIQFHMMESHRLGYFRYRTSMFVLGRVSALACLANLFVAILFKMMTFLPDAFVHKMVLINVLFAITNLLPIPPLDGVSLLFASRMIYLSMFVFVSVVGVLLLTNWLSLIWVLLIGFALGTIVAYLVMNDQFGSHADTWPRKN
jgi:Zn-dependent protease